MSFDTMFEHRDDLISASIDEFEQHGYEGTSLNRILTTAGMSKGQLYHHFTGKQDLFVSLADWAIAEKIRWLASRPQPTIDSEFFEVIRANMTAGLAFTCERPDIHRYTRLLLAERGRPIFEIVTRHVGFGFDTTLDVLVSHHHEAGAFAPDLSVEFVQRVLALLLDRLPDLLDVREPTDLEGGIDNFFAWLRHSLGR